MPFYTGSTADGSDAHEVQGMYINPNNHDEWSNVPYENSKDNRIWNRIREYMSGKYCLNDVYLQIKNKTCPLSYIERKFVLTQYNQNNLTKN
jgi:hypothetical protein